ncbi:MAG: hypothetical protein GY751_13475 [Bacteroidetes bacterium]|nr:hypothetical protein [Bacteroidota bacterium]
MKQNKWICLMSLVLPIFFVGMISSCGEDDPVCTTVGAPCDDGNIDTYNDAFNSDCECVGTLNMFTDIRDGQSYNTVKIGTQTWMKENLNYSTSNSLCYDGSAGNCNVYGRLYDGNEAKSVSPVGWHLPTEAEWTLLVDFLGGELLAGGKMKEAGETHWLTPNTGATNESGFTGLPGGWGQSSSSSYGTLTEMGLWWSATAKPPVEQWIMRLEFNHTQGELVSDEPQAFSLSVRCIRD